MKFKRCRAKGQWLNHSNRSSRQFSSKLIAHGSQEFVEIVEAVETVETLEVVNLAQSSQGS